MNKIICKASGRGLFSIAFLRRTAWLTVFCLLWSCLSGVVTHAATKPVIRRSTASPALALALASVRRSTSWQGKSGGFLGKVPAHQQSYASLVAALPPVPVSLSLLDEVGLQARPVSDAQVYAWKQEVKQPDADTKRLAWLHLWLGEYEMAHNQHPKLARWHFRAAICLDRMAAPSNLSISVRTGAKNFLPFSSQSGASPSGLATYDAAVALFYEGAYADAGEAFHHLLASHIPTSGYSPSRCALWSRRANACASYHAERSDLGIPEPPRLDPLCGAAALAACLRSLHLPYDRKTLLASCRVTGEGSTLQDIVNSGSKLGVSIRAVSADERGFLALPKPLIAHVEHDHFLVVTKASSAGITYLCSDCGPWPGGEVTLTWRQWRTLSPGIYAAVTKPQSAWTATLADALGETRQPVRVASVGSLLGLAARPTAFRPMLQALPFLRNHVIRIEAPMRYGCGAHPVGLSPSPNAHPPMHGDPINLATGEEQQTPAADLVVYNPHGPAVSWGRIYNSLRYEGQGTLEGNNTYESNDYGLGWSQTYNVGVCDPSYGGTGAALKFVFFPNGSRISFTAPAVPAPGTPVQCAVQAGTAMLVEWDYDTQNTLGHYTITFPDRTRWITTTVNYYTLCCSLAQIVDRNNNAINFNYSSAATTGTWPLLSTISEASNGTVLLSIQRATDGTGNIVAVTDTYGRSVYYHVGSYASYSYQHPYCQQLDQVSQIVPAGTPNPASRSLYAYQQVSGGSGGGSLFSFLHTLASLSPTGTGTSTTSINYDSSTGIVSSVQDANGITSSYASVNATGQPSYPSNYTGVTVSDPSGNVVSSFIKGYDSNMNETTATDGDYAVVSTLAYQDPNDPFKPSSVTDAKGRTWRSYYDAYGNVTSSVSPRGVTVTNTWDYSQFSLGELTKTQVSTSAGSLAPTTFAYYEPSGLPSAVTSPKPGAVSGTTGGTATTTTSFTYDFTSQGTHGLGNLLTVTTPGNNAAATITATFAYTGDGTPITSPALGEPLSVTDNLGYTTHLRYNSLGNTVSAIDKLGHEADTVYNIANQPLQSTLPATGQTGTGRATSISTYLYPGGPLTQVTAFDENSQQVRQVSYGYDAAGTALSVSGSAEPVTYTYDALYRLKTQADGNAHTTRYYYTKAGYLDSMTFPGYSGPTPVFDGEGWSNIAGPDSVRRAQYDTDGHLLKSVDGQGTETDYVYADPDGALTDVKYPATPSLNHHMAYDSFGRTSAITDGSGTVQFGTGTTPGYDDAGHVLAVQTTYMGLPARTLSYAYYPNGSRQSMGTPAGSFAYSYDKDGRLQSLTNPFSETCQWTYPDTQPISTQTLANGATTTYTQNQIGQMTDLTTKVAGAITSEFSVPATGGYDGIGNRTSVTATVPALPSASGSTAYQYDQKDQLTSETSQRGGGYTNGFGYDPAGNPTTFRGSGPNIFGVDNQITGAGYVYDGNGNPTTYKGAAVTYDAEDNPTVFGSQLTAGYTGSGLRAWKQGSGGGKTYFLYDGAAPVCEMDASGAVTATNTFGGSGLLSRHTSAGSTFYTFDERGNVAQRLNAAGTPTSTDSYDAYGASATAPPDPFGFGAQFGYYTDAETGLALCQHRYYDNSVGRFLTRDPIGYAGGLNLYAYCANNPVSSADPSGFNPQSDGGDGLNDARDANPLNLFNPVDAYGMSNDAWARAGNGSGTVPAALATTALAGLSIYGAGKGAVMGAAGLARAGWRSLVAFAEAGADLAPEGTDLAAGAESNLVQRARFEVTTDGTAIPTSKAELTQGFQDGNFKSYANTRTGETGTNYVDPANGKIYRVMDGSASNPPRLMTHSSGAGNPPLLPSGANLPGNLGKAGIRSLTHFPLDP